MPIDFTLTREQHELQLAAREFAQEVLVDINGKTRHLPTPEERFAATRPAYEQMIEAGFLRKIIPSPAGGEGTGMVEFALLAEEFVAVDVNVPLTLFATLLGLTPVLLAGSLDQQQRCLEPFLRGAGAPLAAFAFTEPGGSANYDSPDPGTGVRTIARLEGSEWVITGAKQWVSSATGWDGTGADLMCVVCRTDPQAPPGESLAVILVPKPEQGLTVSGSFDSMGHRAHLTPKFRLDGVRVPEENLLGSVGDGLGIVEGSFTGTAAGVGAFSVGVMRAAFDFALDFARTERRAGSVPIIEHQAVGYALADAKTKIEAARYLTWKACHALDSGAPGALELSIQAKIFGSETAVEVITDLMSVVGIDSYGHELPLAGLLQDASAYPLFDGGNMGVRRRQLHTMLQRPDYDPLTASAVWAD